MIRNLIAAFIGSRVNRRNGGGGFKGAIFGWIVAKLLRRFSQRG